MGNPKSTKSVLFYTELGSNFSDWVWTDFCNLHNDFKYFIHVDIEY